MTQSELIAELAGALKELIRFCNDGTDYERCHPWKYKAYLDAEMALSHAQAAQSDEKRWPMQQLFEAECAALFERWRTETGDAASAICKLLADRTFILAQSDGWQPIETAPKDRLIDIWIQRKGRDGECWSQCYYDRICDEWRTSRPSGHMAFVKAECVTHWRPLLPAPPSKQEGA